MKIVFPLFSRLIGEVDIICSCSYVICFPGWERFNFGRLLGGKILRETNIKMADTNLMKNCSVLLSMTISGIDTLIFCLGKVLHLLEIERQQKIFIMCSLVISGENRIRKKLKTLHKNKKRDVVGSSKEEVTHGGPI